MITLGVADLARSRRFYADGFGWKTVLETPDIIFYQMDGLILGTWLASSLADDSRRPPAVGPGAFALAHNVTSQEAVQPTRHRTAVSAVTSPIPTATPGRSPSTPPGRSAPKAM